MKNKNKPKTYTQKRKTQNVFVCTLSFVILSLIALWTAPLVVMILGYLSLILLVVSFSKRSDEEKQVKSLLQQQEALNEKDV